MWPSQLLGREDHAHRPRPLIGGRRGVLVRRDASNRALWNFIRGGQEAHGDVAGRTPTLALPPPAAQVTVTVRWGKPT